MLDYMSESAPRRENIKFIAFSKTRSHLRGGYPSRISPTHQTLLKYKTDAAPLDFASYIRDTFHTQNMDDETYGYRKLLQLSSVEEQELLYGPRH